MARYHINQKTGQSATCVATKRGCPVGGEHFANKEDANQFIEEKLAQSFGMVSTIRKNEPKTPEEIKASNEKQEKLSKVSQIGKKVNKLESQFKEYQKSKEQKGEKVDPEIAKSVAEKIQEGRLKSKALMQEIETISEFERQNKAFNNSMSEIDNAKIDETELNLFRDSKSLEY